MIEVEVSGEIDASADKVWGIVSDFGDVDWMQGVSRSEVEGNGPGMARLIYAGDAPPVREVLEFVDSEKRRAGYTITENLPMPISDYHAVMTVTDLGDQRCRLVWSCTATPLATDDVAAKAIVEGMYGVLIGWVKAHAES